MDMKLDGKSVLITGGSRGIGLATAEAFAREGARVTIAARDRARLAEAAAAVRANTGHEIEAVACDVTDPADIVSLAAALGGRPGGLDILVNNAGTGIYKAFAEVTDDDLAHGMALNFFAQFRVTQKLLPALAAAKGCVINVSGRTAIRGNFPPGSSCTGPAKAAEVRFSIDLATELAELGVRVNCVIPGVVAAEDRFKLWEDQALGKNAKNTSDVRSQLESQSVPTGQRWGLPEDIANVIVFLASPRAFYVNGASLTVDGGPHNKSYVTQLYSSHGVAPAAA